jgi:hypothetical protein
VIWVRFPRQKVPDDFQVQSGNSTNKNPQKHVHHEEMDDIDEKQLDLRLEPWYASGCEIVIELQDKLDRQNHRYFDKWDINCDQEKKP